MGSLFFGCDFPSNLNDFYIVTQKFIDHISTKDNIRNLPSQLDITSINTMVCNKAENKIPNNFSFIDREAQSGDAVDGCERRLVDSFRSSVG